MASRLTRSASLLRIQNDALWARLEAAGPLDSWSDNFEIALGWEADDSSERSRSQYDRRRTFIALYAWAVPSRESIAAIQAFIGERRLLEVCAGSGLWARLLADAGVDVVATDGEPPKEPFFAVAVQEAEAAVRAHHEREALLLCWPPFRKACAFGAISAFAGERLVYVGDPRFTGDQQFHDRLEREWTLRERIPLPTWPGLEDYAYLYARSETPDAREGVVI